MKVGEEPNGTGEPDDSVRIRLGENPMVFSVEEYSFHSAVLQQPAAFTVQLSGGSGAAQVIRDYPPGPLTPCQLIIGGNLQFTGEVDAVNALGDNSRTIVELRGRDLLARLHDCDITGDRSFGNTTYEDLFKAALADVGLGKATTFISNTANKRVRTGIGVKVGKEPVRAGEVRLAPSGGGTRVTVTAKMGESWLTFLERHMTKLGLFMWCDAEGNFVLSRPCPDQEPLYHFHRQRGQARSVSNVKSVNFTNDTTVRFSEVVIFARNGGRKSGHNHVHGDFQDKEMQGLGFVRRRVYRDTAVADEQEARFYSRMKIAEANRAGWKLMYTISGHSTPTVSGSGRAIVVPDTIARVDDDELGIHENLYVESVLYKSPPRETIVTLMRTQDLLFGEEQAQASKKKAETNTRRMLTFVRDRQPIEFKRELASNVVVDPASRAFGLTLPGSGEG